MTLLEVIETEAFSSLWYWVFLALVWTRVTAAPLGIPLEMYGAALTMGPEGERDAFALVRVGVARHVSGTRTQLAVGVGVWAFLLSLLGGLALIYRVELAQALLLLAGPLALVQVMVRRTARRMAEMTPEIDPLMGELRRLRLRVQIVSIAALFGTAVYGMLHSLHRAVL